MNIIDFGSRKIAYILHRENRKRLRIVVAPELAVDVYAPTTADEEQIQAAVLKKAAWIAGKLDALERYHPLPHRRNTLAVKRSYTLGGSIALKSNTD
jgi:predicted metal-dependent hydrolase